LSRLAIDHLVLGTASLAEGRRWLETVLGCPPCGGGAHAFMGTHNALWNLNGCYLELIAIDPDARPPGRRRWFGLDNPAVQARIRQKPRLLAWVAATNALAADLASSPVDPGPAIAARRDALSWKITLAADGTVALDGAFPLLIQWDKGSLSPAKTLSDQGLMLQELRLSLPEDSRKWLAQRGLNAPLRFGQTPGLSTSIGLAGGAGSTVFD
jgi:hypothetical protein